jgi:hypothetical protein
MNNQFFRPVILLSILVLTIATTTPAVQAASKSTLLNSISLAKQGKFQQLQNTLPDDYWTDLDTADLTAYLVKPNQAVLFSLEITSPDFFNGGWYYYHTILPTRPKDSAMYYEFNAANQTHLNFKKCQSTNADTYIISRHILPLSKFGRLNHLTYLTEKTSRGHLRFWLFDEKLFQTSPLLNY